MRCCPQDEVSVIGTTGQLAPELHGQPPPADVTLIPAEKVDLADPARVEALVDIDSPPIAPVTDATILSTRVDGTVLAARAFQTKKDVASAGFAA